MGIGPQPSGGVLPKVATILIVEDDLLLRKTVAEHLLQSGFEVLEAINVEAALGLFSLARLTYSSPTYGFPVAAAGSTWPRLSRYHGRESECCSQAVITSLKAKFIRG